LEEVFTFLNDVKSDSDFLPKNEFLSHNFVSRNDRNSIKGSKDSYYSLASNKNFSHAIGSLRRLPWDDDVIQKCKNLLPLWSHCQKTQNPKLSYFFNRN